MKDGFGMITDEKAPVSESAANETTAVSEANAASETGHTEAEGSIEESKPDDGPGESDPSQSSDVEAQTPDGNQSEDDKAQDGADSEEDSQVVLPPDDHPNKNLKYYAVHTYSMFEEKARHALEERVKANNLEDKFGKIFVPKISTETTLKSGKKKRVERNAFPGYMIVQMEMNESTSHMVRNTPKITGFIGNARKPRPISDREVLRLTSPETVQEQSKQEASKLTFVQGETVKVTDGAFTNFDGIVEAVQADKMKLRILVSIFGRETPVELDYGQVQKLT